MAKRGIYEPSDEQIAYALGVSVEEYQKRQQEHEEVMNALMKQVCASLYPIDSTATVIDEDKLLPEGKQHAETDNHGLHE